MDEFPIVAPPALVSAPLIEYLARRLRAEMESELQTFGLRTRHLIALTLLREFGERGQAELAEAMWVDPTNLVGLLNELEASDLVERRRSAQDRRRHTVALTLAGHRRLAEIGVALARVEQRVLKALNTDEQATLYALLHRAVAAAAECTERPPTSNAPHLPTPGGNAARGGPGKGAGWFLLILMLLALTMGLPYRVAGHRWLTGRQANPIQCLPSRWYACSNRARRRPVARGRRQPRP